MLFSSQLTPWTFCLRGQLLPSHRHCTHRHHRLSDLKYKSLLQGSSGVLKDRDWVRPSSLPPRYPVLTLVEECVGRSPSCLPTVFSKPPSWAKATAFRSSFSLLPQEHGLYFKNGDGKRFQELSGWLLGNTNTVSNQCDTWGPPALTFRGYRHRWARASLSDTNLSPNGCHPTYRWVPDPRLQFPLPRVTVHVQTSHHLYF